VSAAGFQQPNAKRWQGFARRWTPNRISGQVVDPQPVVLVGEDVDDLSALDGIDQVVDLPAGNAGAMGFEATEDLFVAALHLNQRTAALQRFSIAIGRNPPGAITAPTIPSTQLGDTAPSFLTQWEYIGPDVVRGLDVFNTPGVSDRFVTFPPPGILVPTGFNAWVRLQLNGIQTNEINWFLRLG
jgi:hypothetical protein